MSIRSASDSSNMQFHNLESPQPPQEFVRFPLSRQERCYDTCGFRCMQLGAHVVKWLHRNPSIWDVCSVNSCCAVTCFVSCCVGSGPFLSSVGATLACSAVGKNMLPVLGICAGPAVNCLFGKCCLISGESLRYRAKLNYFNRLQSVANQDEVRLAITEETLSSQRLVPVKDLVEIIKGYVTNLSEVQQQLERFPEEQKEIFPIEDDKEFMFQYPLDKGFGDT